MSLRTRIAAAAGIAVALVVVIAAVAIYLGVRAELRGEVDNSLRDRASALTMRGGGGGDRERGPGEPNGGGGRPGPDGAFPALPPEPFGGPEGFAQLVLPSGSVVRASPVARRAPGGRRHARARAQRLGRVPDGRDGVGHARARPDPRHRRAGARSRWPARSTRWTASWTACCWCCCSWAPRAWRSAPRSAAVVARTALAPIDRFTRRTEEIAGDPDPSHRIDVTSKDELGRLARSFNTTLDSLERSVEAQRQLVADASHELRTPIASLRANIQTLEHAERLPAAELESLRADIVAELDELTALVADIVELARGAKPGEAEDEVRLDEIVESVAHRARGRANGIAIDVSTEPTVVRGAPDRIQRAVSNLVDNALKWSPGDGRVEIDLAGGRLSVRDHGPGFQEADLPHVFDRFYRADNARSLPGSGLGLAIVRQAAEAHGGDVEARNAPDGGAVVRVSFGTDAQGTG